MVLELMTQRGHRLIGGSDALGRVRISAEQGGRRVAHRGARETNEVDQRSSHAPELLGPRFPHRLTPRFAAYHGQ